MKGTTMTILHELTKMDWPAALVLIAIVISLTVMRIQRMMIKEDAEARRRLGNPVP